MAYEKMNDVNPHYFDMKSFYKILATCFENLVLLLKKFSKQHDEFNLNKFLLSGDASANELLINGIIPTLSKKVS